VFDTKLEQKVQIKAPVQRVFDFLTDPAKIPLVMPSLIENTNIPPLPLKKDSRFKWKYQMYGVMLQGEWTVTKIESPSRYTATTTGDTASEWDYTLSAAKDGTSVVVAVSYETPKTVLGRVGLGIVQQMNKKELDTYLFNLKTVLEIAGK
jgi:uncharacterized protein YndB with AHSA1/START domain